MAAEYTWKRASRGSSSSFSLPKPHAGGRWIILATVFAILVHVIAFFAAKKIPVVLGLSTDGEQQVDYMNVQRVETVPMVDYQAPEDYIPEPPKDSSKLLDELDALEQLPDDTELDVLAGLPEPEFSVTMEVPALAGETISDLIDPSKGPAIETEMPELGRLEDIYDESQTGRVVVETGEAKADEFDPDAFTDDLLRKGNDSLSEHGAMENFTDLDALLNMPSGSLVDKKAMIGGDLLFEFNSDKLRQSARLSLMKVAMLIDKNQEMYCWIEGHTDSIGSDEDNMDLATRRSESVKQWLIDALGISEGRIISRAFGEQQLIVAEGDKDVQAPNRRVEIKMRKTLPPKVEVFKPEVAKPVEAVLVKPRVTYPGVEQEKEDGLLPDEVPVETFETKKEKQVKGAEVVPQAVPVDLSQEDQELETQKPEEESIPRAVPVDEIEELESQLEALEDRLDAVPAERIEAFPAEKVLE